MKFLIIPGNNSLSHGIKSLAIQSGLQSRGYECLVAISPGREEFFKRLASSYTLLGDIQENDGSAYPTMNWFRESRKITECIEKEMTLMREYKPDLVLGVFRFTAKASAFLSGVPFASLTCGCMLPGIKSVLGFHDDTDNLAALRDFINMFFKSAANKMSKALSKLGIGAVNDIREMLLGNQTYLWDIPEFMYIPERKDVYYAGPVFWNEWMQDPDDVKLNFETTKPLALLTFGTCNGNASILNRMINILHSSGYKVILAAGGQKKLVSLLKNDPRVTVFLYAPFDKILPCAALVVCHGGQTTIFEALAHEVPVAVIPFHPEQSHNGICLERIGCGRMIVPGCRFVGNSSVYSDMLGVIEDEKIKMMIAELVENPETKNNLRNFKNIISKYNGLETITCRLVQ